MVVLGLVGQIELVEQVGQLELSERLGSWQQVELRLVCLWIEPQLCSLELHELRNCRRHRQLVRNAVEEWFRQRLVFLVGISIELEA